jgi:hypothetical protein
MKPGDIETVSINLDLITQPERIATRPLGNAVFQRLPPPSTDEAWCVWVQTYGKTHSNMHNSRKGRQQRRRRSGKP